MKRKYHVNISKDSQFPSEIHSYKLYSNCIVICLASHRFKSSHILIDFQTGSRFIVTSLVLKDGFWSWYEYETCLCNCSHSSCQHCLFELSVFSVSCRHQLSRLWPAPFNSSMQAGTGSSGLFRWVRRPAFHWALMRWEMHYHINISLNCLFKGAVFYLPQCSVWVIFDPGEKIKILILSLFCFVFFTMPLVSLQTCSKNISIL